MSLARAEPILQSAAVSLLRSVFADTAGDLDNRAEGMRILPRGVFLLDKKGKEMIVEKGASCDNRIVMGHGQNPRDIIWLKKETLVGVAALAALTLMSGGATADQPIITTAQLAIDQFYECAENLFKNEFNPAEVNYVLSPNKSAVLFLSVQWISRDGAINILIRIRSIGSTVMREITMTQNGESKDEPPPTAAKVEEHIARVFEECPPEKEDIDCADAVTERWNGIEQVVRNNLEYPDVTVEKYTSKEQVFRASKEVQTGIDDYSLVLNGTPDHKSFGWRTFRLFTPAAVEEALHDPPPRIAKNGSDIRKLQACTENVVSHMRIIPR